METINLKSKKRISDTLENMINTQIQRELDSSMIYLSMSEYLNYVGWFGAAKLFKKYSDEELTHMHKFREYLQDRNVLPKIPASTEQPRTYECIKDIVQKTYDHEVQVSKWISEIASASLKEGDFTTYQMLNWFINEQIEEEAKALYWIDRIEMYEKYNKPIGDLDEEMGDKA